MITATSKTKVSLKSASFISLIIIVLIISLLWFFRNNLDLATSISHYFKLLIDLAVILILISVLRKWDGDKGRLYRAWSFLTATILLYGMADLSLMVFDLFGQNLIVIVTSYILYLLTYPFLMIGMLYFPGSILSPYKRGKMLLDLGIIIVLTTIFSWTFFIYPIISGQPAEIVIGAISNLLYGVLYIFSIIIILDLLFNRFENEIPTPIPLIGLGLLSWMITDFIFIYQYMIGSYSTGSILELGWILGMILFGLAGIAQLNRNEFKFPKYIANKLPIHKKFRWDVYLPMLWVICAFLLLFYAYNNPKNINLSLLTLGVAFIVIMSFTRQLISVNENNRLYEAAQREINQRKEVERSLHESENMYKAIFENTGAATVILDKNNQILMANQEFENITGYKKEDMENKLNFKKFLSEESSQKTLYSIMTTNDLNPLNCQFSLKTKEGDIKDIYMVSSKVKGTEKTVLSILDVTERKKYEKKIKKSLQEKEVLLQEIHHRVKNNMQVISSILGLQSNYSSNDHAKDVLKESKMRVRSMAMVHESIYQTEDLSNINFPDYLQKLVTGIMSSYSNSQNITLTTDLEDLDIDVDTAVPCGLIVNEMVINCLKHAFKDRIQGKINLKLASEDDQIKLVVRDDGIGLPTDFNEKGDTLGLQLIQTLSAQLKGKIEIYSEKGTTFALKFPQTPDKYWE